MKIFISNKENGFSHIYSKLHFKGKKEKIPLYEAFVKNSSGSLFNFKVTRDTNFLAPAKKLYKKYIKFSEAPPNKSGKPYNAIIREDGAQGFRIQFYEKEIDKGNKNTVKGIGPAKRTYINIHFGPACSQGCLLLNNGRKWANSIFQKRILALINEDKKNKFKNWNRILVYIQERK